MIRDNILKIEWDEGKKKIGIPFIGVFCDPDYIESPSDIMFFKEDDNADNSR